VVDLGCARGARSGGGVGRGRLGRGLRGAENAPVRVVESGFGVERADFGQVGSAVGGHRGRQRAGEPALAVVDRGGLADAEHQAGRGVDADAWPVADRGRRDLVPCGVIVGGCERW
jgi:hypothetical protein